jgi:hypothetical protein
MASYRGGGKVHLLPLLRCIALIGVSKEAVLSARTHSGNQVIGRPQRVPPSGLSSEGVSLGAANIRVASRLSRSLERTS